MFDACPLYPRKRTFVGALWMSAFGPIADITPIYSITSSAATCRVCGMQAQVLWRFRVHNEFKCGRLQYRQIGRFSALENPARIDPYLTIGVGRAGSVTRHSPPASANSRQL